MVSAAIMKDLKYYCTLRLAKYERPKPFGNPEFKTEHLIRLPLPAELRDDTSVAYNNIDLVLVGDIANGSPGGGMAAEGLRQAGNLASGMAGMAAGAVGGMSKGFLGQLAGKAAGAVKDALPPEAISSAIQQAAGVAPNPNPSVAFQGPILREMSLTWTFMPTSAEESAQIKRIIQILKMRALPSNTMSGSASILDYPYICQMNFFPWDNTNFGSASEWGWTENSIIKMKRCFMSSVNVNYSAGASPAFFSGDNRPVIIQLSINFKEIEYLLSSDWGGTNGTGSEDEVAARVDKGTAALKPGFDDPPPAEANGDTESAPTKDAAPT